MDELTRSILLLTDFGLSDHYAGQVKSVLDLLAPESAVIDITHGVGKYDVAEGAWMLETAVAVAPPDAVIMAVVDPGVGSERKAICVESDGRSFIGPDNGLLSCAFDEEQRRAGMLSRGLSNATVYELSSADFRRTEVSHTFHGRDIFAPAAAARASGVLASEFGARLDDAFLLAPFEGVIKPDGSISGEVIHADSYGNLVTTIREAQLPAEYVVEVGETTVEGRSYAFSDVADGELLTHIESSGFMAVAANLGSAADELRVSRGALVTVRPR